jgi:hypothetical protein
LEQRGVGELRGFGAFARGAFFEIFKIGGGAQQAFPIFVGLGGARFEFLDLFRREFGSNLALGFGSTAVFRFAALWFGFFHSCVGRAK